jgi:cell division septal protein FtsQ
VAGVLSVRTDRAFPHTLRVVIRPEHPVLILRRGSEGWLVSARGRVLRRLRNAHISSLPRTWVRGDATIAVGETLAPDEGGLAAAVLAPAAGSRLFGRVQTVRVGESELALRLRSGIEIRLGDIGDLRLKLAIARRILATLTANDGLAYIDVSVPERPVVGS